MIQMVYCVIAMIDFRSKGSLSGIFQNKNDAIRAVLEDGPHNMRDNFYNFACIEKHRFDSLGYPAVMPAGQNEKTLWFRWEADKWSECETPDWATNTFGWV